MSKTINHDLDYIKKAILKDDAVINAYDTGYLFGRLASENWIKAANQLPKKEGEYLVSDGRKVGISQWNGVGFKRLAIRQPVTYWKLLPLPPRSEIGRDK